MTLRIPIQNQPKPEPAPVIVEKKDDRGVLFYAQLAGIMGICLEVAVFFGVGATWMKNGLGWYAEAMIAFAGWTSAVWIIAGIGGFALYVVFFIWRPTKHEDEDRLLKKAQLPSVQPIYQTLEIMPAKSMALAGQWILCEHFYNQPELTREQAEQGGLCSQGEWNVFNAIAKQYEIRTANNRWNPAKDDEAMYLWFTTTFEIIEKGVLIAHLVGGLTLRFDMTKNGTHILDAPNKGRV